MIVEKEAEEDKIIPKKTIGCRVKTCSFFIAFISPVKKLNYLE
jgi:hypothetical protein